MIMSLMILICVSIVSLLSLIGVFFLAFGKKRLHSMLLNMVSFSAGALFGNAILHLLPEAFEHSSVITAGSLTLSGIVAFFLLEKIIHWHHLSDHHNHHHLGLHEHDVHALHRKTLGITNLAGDLLHNTIDGMAIAASFLISEPLGIATTIAIIAHEIPKEAANFGVLLHAGFSISSALFFNFLTALGAVLGAFIVIILQGSFNIQFFLIPFTAGSFLYIAGTDLLPEVHRTGNTSELLKHCCWLIIGMLVMVVLVYYGPEHQHCH